MSALQPLWAYHEAYMELTALEAELNSTPANMQFKKLHKLLFELKNSKSELQTFLDRCNTMLISYGTEAEELDRRLELEINEVKLMQSETECTLAEVNEEKATLDKLVVEIKQLRAKIFDISQKISEAQSRLKSTLAKGTKAKKEYNEVVKVCDEERDVKKAELDRINSKIAEASKTVPPELLKIYKDALRTHSDPIVMLSGAKCSGCNMSLPTSIVRRVEADSEIVLCDNCGRILYSEVN